MRKLGLEGWAVISCLVVVLFGCTGDLPKTSDEQIDNDSFARLKMDSRVNADNIRVESKDHTVTLTGHVDTLHQKYLAETIVGATRLGIRGVINRINVIPPMIEDQIIASDIRDGLDKEPMLRRTAIKVEVSNGIAHLSGTVKTAEQMRLAMEVAARPVGIVDVVSELKMLTERMPDADVAKEVNTYLRVSPLVKEGRISVSVKDGTIHLRGEVDQLMGKVMLIEDIGHLRGVVDVESEIQVR
jgi:osmotically-inducible protein OsmY